MYFNGWNKGIISVIIIIIIIIITIIIIVITMRWISNYNNNNNNNNDLLTDPLGGSSLLELPCARTKRHPTTAYTGQHKKWEKKLKSLSFCVKKTVQYRLKVRPCSQGRRMTLLLGLL